MIFLRTDNLRHVGARWGPPILWKWGSHPRAAEEKNKFTILEDSDIIPIIGICLGHMDTFNYNLPFEP